jgi:Methyltransferase domain
MDDAVRRIAEALYAEGAAHDAAEPDRLRRRRNLEPGAAAVLAVVLRAMTARAVVEIGTSNGYSTLWLADAVRATGGRVLSVDLDAEGQAAAAATLRQAGLDGWVDLRRADGGAVLRVTCPPAARTSSCWTPNGRSTRGGGRTRCGCYGRAACWWWTTCCPTRRRSPPSWPCSTPTPS